MKIYFVSLKSEHYKLYNGNWESVNSCSTGTVCEIILYCFKDTAINNNKSTTIKTLPLGRERPCTFQVCMLMTPFKKLKTCNRNKFINTYSVSVWEMQDFFPLKILKVKWKQHERERERDLKRINFELLAKYQFPFGRKKIYKYPYKVILWGIGYTKFELKKNHRKKPRHMLSIFFSFKFSILF